MKKREEKRRTRQLVRWVAPLMAITAVNFLLRLSLIWINEAEYTDGVLQVTQFEHPTGIWPPLYTMLTWPFSLVMGKLWAGRLVSVLFSSAAVIPLYMLARRSFGFQAALFTGLLYSLCPAALRWAPRMMTDATFSFFFWFACERLLAAQGAKDRQEADSALMWANVLGTLAALTRYQGLMLTVPVLAIGIAHYRFWGFVPLRGIASVALYSLVFLWSTYAGNIHGSQFSDRLGQTLGGAIMTIILNAESFLLFMPYFLTYPVTVVVLIGLIKGRSRPRKMMKPLTFYVLIVLLFAQSAFGSFQERYFLPVIGLLLVWGGVGLAASDNILRKSAHNRLRPYPPIICGAWCGLWAILVLLGGREAFGDLRAGAERAAEMAGPGERLFTNEIYREARGGERIAADKVAFFARRDAIYLTPGYYEGQQKLRVRDVLVLSSAYTTPEAIARLNELYELEPDPMNPGGFEAIVIPVYPDIMAVPGTNQNPAWFNYRYTPQPFRTMVYRVTRVRFP